MNASAAVSEQSHSDEEGDGLFGGSSDEDDDDEEDSPEELEQKRRIKLLLEEAGDLDRAIAAKQTELAKAMNPIFRVRRLIPSLYRSLTIVCDARNDSRTRSRSLRPIATSRKPNTQPPSEKQRRRKLPQLPSRRQRRLCLSSKRRVDPSFK